MNFGGGVNFKVHDSTSIFFEIRYHYVWGPSLDLATSRRSRRPAFRRPPQAG